MTQQRRSKKRVKLSTSYSDYMPLESRIQSAIPSKFRSPAKTSFNQEPSLFVPPKTASTQLFSSAGIGVKADELMHDHSGQTTQMKYELNRIND